MKICLQEIALMNLNLWLLAEPKPHLRCEGAVQLERDQPTAAHREDIRDRPMPRPNLDNSPVAYIAERINDGMPGTIIDEEILTQL